MFCSKCGKEIKETTGFCSHCGERIVIPHMTEDKSIKSGSDFNRGMGIALLAGICILIRMMIGMGVLIILVNWPQISLMISNLI